MKSGERHRVEIHAGPFLQDHRFLGKAALPAVEAMKALAHSTRALADELDVARIRKALFLKFLYVPPEAERIEAFNLVERDDGDNFLRSSLVTVFRSKASSITRPVTHVALQFGPREDFAEDGSFDIESFRQDGAYDDAFEIEPEFIYERMVPFGPAFRNIAAPVRLTRRGVFAEVSGGCPEYVEKSPLGSPFPLDAGVSRGMRLGATLFSVRRVSGRAGGQEGPASHGPERNLFRVCDACDGRFPFASVRYPDFRPGRRPLRGMPGGFDEGCQRRAFEAAPEVFAS